MFTRKKIKKFEEIAKKCNEAIRVLKEGLQESAGSFYDCELKFYFDIQLGKYILSTDFYRYDGKVMDCYKKKSLKEYAEEADFKLGSAYQKAVELHEWLKVYKKQCEENKAKLTSQYANEEIPLFIVLEPLIPCLKEKYCFCYEFHDSEKVGTYSAYIFSNADINPHSMMIDYNKYAVRPMTRAEFERVYLMNRLNDKNFNTEEEAVEYDNYLRRLFNGQERN